MRTLMPLSASSALASDCIRISEPDSIKARTSAFHMWLSPGRRRWQVSISPPTATRVIGPMPIPANGPIEGDPTPGTGDRHVLVLNNSNCFLYELFSAYMNTNGSWNAGSAAVWDLLSNEQRPWTWTSADAAGLPIFPGLARYDEVAAGQIAHALRFTCPVTRRAYVPPARHFASTRS